MPSPLQAKYHWYQTVFVICSVNLCIIASWLSRIFVDKIYLTMMQLSSSASVWLSLHVFWATDYSSILWLVSLLFLIYTCFTAFICCTAWGIIMMKLVLISLRTELHHFHTGFTEMSEMACSVIVCISATPNNQPLCKFHSSPIALG